MQPDKFELCRFSRDRTKPYRLFCTLQEGRYIYMCISHEGKYDSVFFSWMFMYAGYRPATVI
ncbi:hypothetical protein Hanom_Chr07g00606941 [Helianthus anomalus]